MRQGHIFTSVRRRKQKDIHEIRRHQLVYFCLNKEGKTYNSYDILSLLYQRNPNDKRLLRLIQYLIHYKVEGFRYGCYSKKLYDFTLNVLNEGKSKNLAPWYYTASFLADKLCDTVQALEYIRQAKSLPAGQDLRDAICVFDIYLQAKSVENTMPILKITSTMN